MTAASRAAVPSVDDDEIYWEDAIMRAQLAGCHRMAVEEAGYLSLAATLKTARRRRWPSMRDRLLDACMPEPNSGCWLLLRPLNADGYGSVSVVGKLFRASRLFYEFFRSPIAVGLQLDHLCRNRACVNPDHLESVTPLVNTLRGEGPTSQNAKKTHCVAGHEFTPANTGVRRVGNRDTRVCRSCGAAWARDKRRRTAQP